ncbi:MAG: hypothetical protein AAFZ10_01485 [Pseudomonadota bacterium]
MRIRIVILALALILANGLSAQDPTAPPFDQAEEDASFLTYRNSLLQAVADRNVDAILAKASEDITFSFGGASGQSALRAFLQVDAEHLAPEQKHEAPAMRERNWAELETVLRLGGVFNEEDAFVAPYTWGADYPSDMDPFEVLFITADGVALRDRPIRFGEVVARLRYDVVTFRNWVTGTQFVEIEMANGTTGFVHRDFARFLVDYRATFAKQEGAWKMTSFIAGD